MSRACFIHPDNIGGGVIYPSAYVLVWEPNGSGPIFIR